MIAEVQSQAFATIYHNVSNIPSKHNVFFFQVVENLEYKQIIIILKKYWWSKNKKLSISVTNNTVFLILFAPCHSYFVNYRVKADMVVT